MAMSLGDILVSVRSDTSQLVSGFNRAEKSVQKTTKNMTTAVKTFAAAYIGLNAIDLARTMARQADAMTNVNSKLKLVTTSSEQLLKVQKEIFNLSQNTRSSFTGNIELYQRMAMATKNLNLSQNEMIGLTKSINQAMTISGTTASGAQALVVQLGQAFSSNFQAVAQELGTIRDQAPRLYQAMLDGTGMTSAAFKKAAEDGKLSSDIIIKALQAQSASVSKDFGKMVITIDGANQQISNSFTTAIGKFDQMAGASKIVAAEISSISKSIDEINIDNYVAGYDFVIATLSRTIDMFNLLYETAENTAQNSVSGIANLVYGTLAPISHMLSVTTEGLNNIGLSSNTNVEDALKLEISLYEMAEKAQNDIKQNTKEITEAFYKANVPIEERVALYRKERAEIIENVKQSKVVQPYSDIEELTDKQIKAQQKAEEYKIASIGRGSQAWYNSEMEDARVTQEKYDLIGRAAKQWHESEAEDRAREIEALDEKYNSMASILDMQISLAESGQNWSNSLSGVAGAIQDIGNATTRAYVTDLKLQKEKLKSESKYKKVLLDTSKTEEEVSKAYQQYKAEDIAMQGQQQVSTLGAYSQMAAAGSAFFEEGTAGAIAMQAAQIGLQFAMQMTAIANAAAAATAAGTGDPYTAPARVAAMISLMAGVLSMFGVSGGGGGTAPSQTPYASGVDRVEAQNKPILDRLDRQIDLLEQLNFQGTAGSIGVTSAGKTFSSGVESLAQQALGDMTGAFRGYLHEDWFSGAQWADFLNEASQNKFIDVGNYNSSVENIVVNKDAVANDYIGFIQSLADSSLQNVLSKVDGDIVYSNLLNDIFAATNEYVTSMLGITQEMQDASDSLKDIYDGLTGTTRYESERLNQAFKDFDAIRGNQSYADYISTQIDDIAKVQENFDEDLVSLFLSENVDNINKQIEALNQLSLVTGLAFDNGIEDALNYIDSIKLVGDALTSSTENIKSWYDSFKSQEQLASDLAQSIFQEELASMRGMSNFSLSIPKLVDSFAELDAMMIKMSSDKLGLTDLDLEFLNINKTIIEETLDSNKAILDSTLSSITDSISSLDSIFKSLESTIDKLRGTAIGSSYSMQKYYDSMSKTLSLSGSDDIDSFQQSLNDTVSASSVLFDASNFATSNDQKFAQLVAANQFETLENSTLTQIDILKAIEYNTRSQLDSLTGGSTSVPSFAVGTANITNDMIANVHRGEGIIPAPFMSSVRNGEITIGSADNSEQIRLLREQNALLNGIISELVQSKDIQNASAENLEFIAKVS